MSSPTLKLNDGHSIPTVGLGCWMSKPVEGDNPETYEMVTKALKVSVRISRVSFDLQR
jgi:diketogulonate reductase-like aldo/keto reductase